MLNSFRGIRTCPSLLKKFSTTSIKMAPRDYIVIVPDKAGAYEKRMEVRPKHLEAAALKFKEGRVTVGGGYADEFPAEGEAPQLKGSVLSVTAESKEEVIEFLKQDIYYKSGVWDVDNAQIHAVSSGD